MVSLVNGDGNNSGGYTFDDSDDTDGTSTDRTPLVRQEPSEDSNRHIHIITGYISLFETILLLVYVGGGLAGLAMSITSRSHSNCSGSNLHLKEVYSDCTDKFLVAIMCMGHSLLWVIVACLDRVIQWQHQVIRRRGYLKFYRRMRNLRRIPFIMISTGTAILLIFMSYLYLVNKDDGLAAKSKFQVKYVMCIIVGLEMIVAISSLIIYIVLAVVFNIQRPRPDVIQDTSSISNSPTATLTTVGFRDGEDLDELLERQADMIRYLQQHNASLGRRIMELQSRTIE